MTARRASAAPTSLALAWPALAVLAAFVATYFGLPGGVAAWLVLLVGAWMEQPPLLTGKKDKAGNSSAANPRETRALRRYRTWNDRRAVLWLTLIGPLSVVAFWVLTRIAAFRSTTDEQAGRDWLEKARTVASRYRGTTSLPIRGDHVIAAFAAVAAATAADGVLLRLLNALFLASAITAVAWSRRSAQPGEYPGTEVTKRNLSVVMGQRLSLVTSLAAAALAAPAAFLLALMVAALLPGRIAPAVVFAVASASVAAAAILSVRLRRASLRIWKEAQQAGALWASRWEICKIEPAPACIEVQTIGSAMVYTFEAPGNLGALGMLNLMPKIAPTLDAGTNAYFVACPNIVGGQPVPGSGHPTRFRIAVWDASDIPDITDPATPRDVVQLHVDASMGKALDDLRMARVALIDIATVTAPDSPTLVYQTTWGVPYLPQSFATMREYGAPGALASMLGCEAVADHRAEILYVGDLFGENTVYADEKDGESATRDRLRDICTEDAWDGYWKAALKQGANPPTIKLPNCKTAEVGGIDIHRDVFVTRVGLPPSDYFGLESRLAAAKVGVPFLCITGFPALPPAKPGERHPQALAVIWSQTAPPGSPDKLAPPRRPARSASQFPDPDIGREIPFRATLESGHLWVLAGHVHKAFAATRLAKPEVYLARCLTSVRSRTHIWQVDVALHGGTTVRDVRTSADRLRQALGVPWLRVADAGHGYVTIFAGADPGAVTLADPDADLPVLENLNWQAAWLAANTSGKDGTLPVIESVSTLPRNESVKAITTTIPDGMSLEIMRAAIPKLRVPTRYSFIDIRPGGDPVHAVILACEDNPIPAYQPYDFAQSLTGLAFATGIDGEPVTWNPKDDPHILLAGVTGGGKTAAASTVLYSARAAGYKVVIIDTIKGAADFGFMADQCLAVARDRVEAAATMKAIYAEIRRRVDLATQYAATSIDDLPEAIRPPRWIVLIDEFASTIAKSAVPPVSDDPDVIAEREKAQRDNDSANIIGSYAGRFAREARSAGIHMVLAAQGLGAKALDSVPGGDTLKKNLARTLLGKASWGDRNSALRVADAAPMLDGDVPVGRAVWEPLRGAAGVVQFWYADQERFAAELHARVGTESDVLDIEPFMPKARPEDAIAAFGRLDDVYDPAADLGAGAVDLGELDLGELDLGELDLDPGDPGQHEPLPWDDEPWGAEVVW